MLVNWFISIGMKQQLHILKVMVIFRFENLEIWQYSNLNEQAKVGIRRNE